MTLKDFYCANDIIDDYSEITVHTTPKTYSAKTINPLDESTFHHYLGYTIEYFTMDKNRHWHILVIE